MISTKAVVSGILFKYFGKDFKIFLQTRWKPKRSPDYSGMLEIPAGVIDPYENIFDALRREVKEETNLHIIKNYNILSGKIEETRKSDVGFVFQPFICQQVLETNNGLPWIGFVFLCEVEGEVIIQESEAKDPMWVSIEELEVLLMKKENIFILQYPVLKYFVEQYRNGKLELQ